MKTQAAAIALTVVVVVGGSNQAVAGDGPTTVTAEQLGQVETLVNNQLKDPESARYRNVGLSTRAAAACGEVNAKNSMGGYTGFTRFVLTLNPTILTMETEGNLAAFSNAWFAACSTLEEAQAWDQKLKKLDAGSAKLADELCKKTPAFIQSYSACMKMSGH